MSGELEASLWGAVLGALAGGVVSHFSERSHDSRRRREVLKDQFGDLSVEFSSDVNTYWSSSGPDAALQSRILSGITKIRVKLTQIGVDPALDADARRLIKELYQFATGGTFATKNHAPDLKRARDVDRRLEKLAIKVSAAG